VRAISFFIAKMRRKVRKNVLREMIRDEWIASGSKGRPQEPSADVSHRATYNHSMRTIRLILSYDGAPYCGWQVQPNGTTVQQVLAETWKKITREDVAPVASGRTDSGVHALRQPVAFPTESKLSVNDVQRALNAELPDSIRVLEASEAEPSFDPVRHAKRKLYRYVIHDGAVADVHLQKLCWRVRSRLDVEAMNDGARRMEGTHDFRCFETEWPNRASSVRTVFFCRASRLGDFVSIDVEANGFLYNMVRAIAGTLAEVGRGVRSPDSIDALLGGGDRSQAGPTAPAQGLFLVRVDYAGPTDKTGSAGSNEEGRD
jgi:tRNA pseudouridine38-40 synthase